MGIARGVVEQALEFAHHIVAKDVLDFLGVIVHVVRRDVGGVGQVKLPEPMVADDRAGQLPTAWCEQDFVALLV